MPIARPQMTIADVMEMQRLQQQKQEGVDRNMAQINWLRNMPLGYGGMGGPGVGDPLVRDAQARMVQLYLSQHFPGYASSGSGVNIGKNIYAPRIGSRSRGGRGYYGGYGGYGGEMPEGYYPRVVARGVAPAPAIYPGMGPGTVMAPQTDWTRPKTVEEIQADQWAAREAAGVTNLATPAYGMQPTSRGYMWIGGPEGDKSIAAAKETDALMEELGYY